MRIIAGEFRGRTLLGPAGQNTRPITDRVKQSVFDILAPGLEEAVVGDFFAGTGSMGLECLSRGAKFAYFLEADRSALARLRQNIEALGVGDRSRVIAEDLFRSCRAGFSPPMWKQNGGLKPALHPAAQSMNIAFLDPPYRFLTQSPQSLQQLAAGMVTWLAPHAIVVFRHDAADQLSLPGLNIFDQREYGSMTVEFLKAARA